MTTFIPTRTGGRQADGDIPVQILGNGMVKFESVAGGPSTPVAIDAMFWQTDVAAAATDAPLTSPGVTATALVARYLIPSGWTANIFAITVYAEGTVGFDITSVETKLFVATGDQSANFASTVFDPSQDSMKSVLASPFPYTFAAGSAPQYITVKVTTNGTTGTMSMNVHVLGEMYPTA